MSSQTTVSIALFSWSMNIFPKCRSLASYTSFLSSCQSGRAFGEGCISDCTRRKRGWMMMMIADHDTIFIGHASHHY